MAGIYLDFNASTPIAPEVAARMRPLLESGFGNPSSGHWAGREARAAIDRARAEVAGLLGAAADEVVFTSGGSEAINHALKGAFFARRAPADHVVVSAVEHPATLNACRFLESLGARVTRVPVDATGLVDPDDVRRAIGPRTFLVSIMHANNEVGTIEPIPAIAAIVRERGVLMHVDAAQTIGKLPVRVNELGCDLLSLAGHKFHAPKGVGAFYVRRGVALEPLIHGGGQEQGRRSGTESALLAAALGAAAELAGDLGWTENACRLRNRLWGGLQERFGRQVVLNGHAGLRLPNTLNVAFVGRVGAEVLAALGDVAASTGSACHSGRIELSPVLHAMGVKPETGMGAVRFSLGRTTTAAEIDAVLARFRQLAA